MVSSNKALLYAEQDGIGRALTADAMMDSLSPSALWMVRKGQFRIGRKSK
jgi:hypothetical protein